MKYFHWQFDFFSSRSWSSPLFVIQTRTWIRPRNSFWLVSICYCSVWNAWHLCLKDRGQVSGGGEWCPATETRSSASLLQHSGTSQSRLAQGGPSRAGTWADFEYLLCPLKWPCMCMSVCVFDLKEPDHANLKVISEPSFPLNSREH